MNLEDERKLKFDRRLSSRPGWITPEDLQAELDSLPDSASKIHTPGESESARGESVAGEPGERPRL